MYDVSLGPDDCDTLRQNLGFKSIWPGPYRGGRRQSCCRTARKTLSRILLPTGILYGGSVSRLPVHAGLDSLSVATTRVTGMQGGLGLALRPIPLWGGMAPIAPCILATLPHRRRIEAQSSPWKGCRHAAIKASPGSYEAPRSYSLVSDSVPFNADGSPNPPFSSIGVIVLQMTYGIKVAEANNKYLDLVEEGNATGEHMVSATSILEFIPALARLPTWLPGTSFLRTLERSREAVRQMRTVPWNDTKHGLVVGFTHYSATVNKP